MYKYGDRSNCVGCVYRNNMRSEGAGQLILCEYIYTSYNPQRINTHKMLWKLSN